MAEYEHPSASLFAGWLEAQDRGDTFAFDAFCARHPEHADALRALHAAHERQQVPPTVDIGASDGSDDAWGAFLDQLRSRGTNWTRYLDEGEVARGGMGSIRRVYDQDARRRLALKVMLDARGEGTPAGSEASLGRFLEEAQVTSQLDHPGVVPVHEIGVDADDRVYFTMKLVKGDDLRAVFDRVADPNDEEWTTTRALNVMLRVCEAMAYAHAKGVIHRDLKPGNVMVGKYGEAYVMDWGLAKAVGREDRHDLRIRPDSTASLKSERKDAAEETPDSPILTMGGDVVGTPAYMPPEQALGRVDEVGPPADVYAVGAMLYHLLAGRIPYTRPGGRITARTILTMVIQGPPPPLAGLVGDAPAELVAIVEKAMEREIDDRYPEMTALARDLQAFLEKRVVLAYETGAWAELKKWVQRNRAVASMAAATLVLVSGIAGWSNSRIRAERQIQRERVSNLTAALQVREWVEKALVLEVARPEAIDRMEQHLVRARSMFESLAYVESELREIRRAGHPLPHPRDAELAGLEEQLDEHRSGVSIAWEALTSIDPLSSRENAAQLEEAIDGLRVRIERERNFEFGEGVEAREWHDTLRNLLVYLHENNSESDFDSWVPRIERSLRNARTIHARSIDDQRAAWGETVASIADVEECPKYHGLSIAPQIGLVPLGRNVETGLWEFWHVLSGERPVRDERGRFVIGPETGLVLVLVPGGTYDQGAQAWDEDGPNYDPLSQKNEHDAAGLPVPVTLSPFFLSKYEMTQGQWVRSRGANPSYWKPGFDLGGVAFTLDHPVENVGHSVARAAIRAWDLDLPTEAQWEYACRAGTDTPWWTGRDRETLRGAVNIADQSAKSVDAPWPEIEDWPDLVDGFVTHAPVATFRANPWGFHHVHGNVWEWCLDPDATYDVAPRTGDGYRVSDSIRSAYANRGGGYRDVVMNTRSSRRSISPDSEAAPDLGLRPARRLRE